MFQETFCWLFFWLLSCFSLWITQWVCPSFPFRFTVIWGCWNNLMNLLHIEILVQRCPECLYSELFFTLCLIGTHFAQWSQWRLMYFYYRFVMILTLHFYEFYFKIFRYRVINLNLKWFSLSVTLTNANVKKFNIEIKKNSGKSHIKFFCWWFQHCHLHRISKHQNGKLISFSNRILTFISFLNLLMWTQSLILSRLWLFEHELCHLLSGSFFVIRYSFTHRKMKRTSNCSIITCNRHDWDIFHREDTWNCCEQEFHGWRLQHPHMILSFLTWWKSHLLDFLLKWDQMSMRIVGFLFETMFVQHIGPSLILNFLWALVNTLLEIRIVGLWAYFYLTLKVLWLSM